MGQYSEGVATVVSGDQTVEIPGAELLSNVAGGDVFFLPGTSVPYQIGSITDDDTLELVTPYAGSSASGQQYVIHQDNSPNLGLPLPQIGDQDQPTLITRAMLVLDTKLAVAASANLGTMALQNANAVAITGGTAAFTGTMSSAAGATVTGAIAALAANSLAMDYNSGTRVLAVGPDASTAGTMRLIVTSTDGSPYVEAATLAQTLATFNIPLAVTGLLDLSGASSGQIKFPATQNASADANTLDDYEEGTFTPSLTGVGGSAVSYTPGSDTGRYTKIGNLVTASMLINGTWTGGPPASWRISLPFTAGSDPNPPFPIYNSNIGGFVGTGGGSVEGGLSSLRTFATLTSGESLTAGGSFFV